jgi:hypothetical protein
MLIFLALVLLALAILTMVLYGNTPHGGPTTSCGPIHFLNHTFTISADCRFLSIGELLIAFVFFFLAVAAAISSRPGQRTP